MSISSQEFTDRRHNVITVAWSDGPYRCKYESHGIERRTVTVYFRDEVVCVKPCTDASDAYNRALRIRLPESAS